MGAGSSGGGGGGGRGWWHICMQRILTKAWKIRLSASEAECHPKCLPVSMQTGKQTRRESTKHKSP